MTTYTDVALEEIRNDYPQAYEILKKAIKPDYEPFYMCTTLGSKGTEISAIHNTPQVIINCPYIQKLMGSNNRGVFFSGVIKLEEDAYSFKNSCVSKHSSEHQLILEMEKIDGTI